jgi:PAS domain S-box-containing protein
MTHIVERQSELSVEDGWLPEELLTAGGAQGALCALFEGHPDLVVVADERGCIAGGNLRLLQELGYCRAQLEGQSIAMLLPQQNRARHDEHLRSFWLAPATRKMGAGVEPKIRDAEGNCFPVDVTLWPIACGARSYVMAVCRRLDALLAQSQMHVRVLVEGVRNYAINLLDADGRILTWNAGSQRIHGLSATEALGRNFSILFPLQEAESGEPARLLEEAARLTRCRVEGWRRGAGGKSIWAEIDLNAIYDIAGKLSGYICVLHDATEHKLSEESLRKLNFELEQYRVILENIDEHAIYTLDADGGITGWGTGAQRMLGYTAEEVLGRHYAIFSMDEDRQAGVPQRELMEAAAAGRCLTDSWRLRSDGSVVWSSGVISAVRDEAGGLVGYVRVARDRTEEKMFTDAQERLAVELEERVTERTRQLEATVAELRSRNEEARQHAEVISRNLREKEMLLREIHHRVKNNLQVVQSLLKMRARLLPAGESREAFETTVERVSAMALLHERLYQTPDLAGLPLSSYVRDLFRDVMASNSLEPGQIQFKLDADEIPLKIEYGVPFGLLMNELMCNSLKHAFPDGKRGIISVSAHRVAGGVRVVVEDDGRGLPEDFDPATSPSMGLKLAGSLARQLGGRLEFCNRSGCCVIADLTRM